MLNRDLERRSVQDRPNSAAIELELRDFGQFPERNLEPRQGADFLDSHDPAHQLDFVVQHVNREIDGSVIKTGCSRRYDFAQIGSRRFKVMKAPHGLLRNLKQA